ncbi:GNAT family N-acetyltransferase [Sutcliffiella rhizosphaerae]|uniref:N-acetyltransferase domain-containing protein n=1 Tax=Sutcliffiella rhizosphaerae TaxID=2880967 RepID=A0ABM8YKG3_9BACI|nr:GNAT family N-acetyltransferase [Sutcliffiella rhizosphaerae]CAG9620427.1 hypothetical protein BACCIP111883_01195 [Sutcliffiella rhizosphaerae]
MLNQKEGWSNLVQKEEETKIAWQNSTIKYVVYDGEILVGYVRGMTDKYVTLYVCEILINQEYRGLGIGEQLLKYIHSLYPKTRMELLASSSSSIFYEKLGFRKFYGYRKSYGE